MAGYTLGLRQLGPARIRGLGSYSVHAPLRTPKFNWTGGIYHEDPEVRCLTKPVPKQLTGVFRYDATMAQLLTEWDQTGESWDALNADMVRLIAPPVADADTLLRTLWSGWHVPVKDVDVIAVRGVYPAMADLIEDMQGWWCPPTTREFVDNTGKILLNWATASDRILASGLGLVPDEASASSASQSGRMVL